MKRVVQRDLVPNGQGVCTVELPAGAAVLGAHLDPRGRSTSSVLLPKPKPEPVLVLSALVDDAQDADAHRRHLRTFVLARPNEPIVESADTFLEYAGQIAMTDVHVFERCEAFGVDEESGA